MGELSLDNGWGNGQADERVEIIQQDTEARSQVEEHGQLFRKGVVWVL